MIDSLPMAHGARPRGPDTGRDAGSPALLDRARPLWLFVGFAALSLAVYGPALHGGAISDDFVYVVYNPYLAALSAENLRAIFDPFGPVAANTVNYAPLHMLLHAMEVQVFAGRMHGYHLVNVLVHAGVATLLVALLRASAVPVTAALLGGLIFAVHPANVEAVAWIFQLKTSAALGLALGALLAWRRHPAVATLLFALALLTKASAAFALPMAAALSWSRAGGGARAGTWLASWTALLALYAVAEFAAFRHAAPFDAAALGDPWVQLRTIAAIGARYLAMAATSHGVSAFHETPPAVSPLDPWWLAALPLGALLAWRTVSTLRRRREEAAWWIGAAAAFAPISQLFPFVFPMADRYLYFILPGLIGGVTLWGVELRERAASPARAAALSRVALAGGLALAVFFALHSAQRAALWTSEERVMADAAQHYPDGRNAHFARALEAMDRGDDAAAVAALRDAVDRGIHWVRMLSQDARLVPLRDAPGFRELMREVAAQRIQMAHRRENPSQVALHGLALAHQQLGEYAEAADLIERALRTDGPLNRSQLIALLLELRHDAAAARAREAEGADGEGAQ